MPTIIIQGTVIEFPNSGASPNWSPAIIEFAEAVESALEGVAGTYDVAPQVLNIDAYNPGVSVDITALNFPTSEVQSAIIDYAVYRTTSLTSATEAGRLSIVYNPNGPVSNKWEIARETVGPDGEISFYMTDSGQLQFTTNTLAGINHTGIISFSAKALLQSN